MMVLAPVVLYLEDHRAYLHLEKALIFRHEQKERRTKGEEDKEVRDAIVRSFFIRADGFVGHAMSSTITQLCWWLVKAAIDDI